MGRPRVHNEATAQALLAAAERIVETDGIDALSLRRVAREVGTTTRAVYSVFGSKDALLAALGRRAFEILERERPIDLLVVDYAMPEMNGLAVIDRAMARHEGLKALLISGHAEILHAGAANGVPLLAKPFKVAELRRRIAETLFASSPDAGLCALNSRVLAVPG